MTCSTINGGYVIVVNDDIGLSSVFPNVMGTPLYEGDCRVDFYSERGAEDFTVWVHVIQPAYPQLIFSSDPIEQGTIEYVA